MPNEPYSTTELDALLAGAVDLALDDTQMARLEQLLSEPQVIDYYVDHVILHAMLQWEHTQPPNGVPGSLELPPLLGAACEQPAEHRGFPGLGFLGSIIHGPVGHFSSDWPVAYLVAAVILSVGLFVGSFVHVSSPVQVVNQSVPLPSPSSSLPASSQFVGRITGMVDCQWSDPHTAVPGPVAVPLGRKYALSSGLMEITYDSGAKVILQGPCTYEVESAAGGYLSLGKLTARVDKREERRTKNEERSGSNSLFLIPHSYFAVRTPTAVVTDLGTEFGIEVDEAGGTTSHVFRGSVSLQLATIDGETDSTPRILRENESALVARDASGRVSVTSGSQTTPVSFVRCEQLQQLAQQRQLKPLADWKTYLARIRRDPSLEVCYDFQRHEDSPHVLHATADSSGNAVDGAIKGATWTKGRTVGKQALHFDGVSSCVKVCLPRRMTQMTLAVWLTIEFLDDNAASCGLLMSDGWYSPEKCHWQITRPGEIHFGSHGEGITTSALLPWQDWSRDRWHHLVLVCDPSHGETSCYLDGKRVCTGAISSDFSVTFGDARIGGWRSVSGEDERGFHGRMDEFLMFSRALTDEEISELHNIGRP